MASINLKEKSSRDPHIDEEIYLKESRHAQPKEIFKATAGYLRSHLQPPTKNFCLLDVGCATGEFIHYLRHLYPQLHYTGIDVSAPLVAAARKLNPECHFFKQSILNKHFFEKNKFDFITCMGVFSIFSEIGLNLHNLLNAVTEGCILIGMITNKRPVDVLMKYKRSDIPGAAWESGWNIFSQCTVEKELINYTNRVKWKWHEFIMPFAIRKRDDPMRSWTIETELNKRQCINGAMQLLDTYILEIQVHKGTLRKQDS